MLGGVGGFFLLCLLGAVGASLLGDGDDAGTAPAPVTSAPPSNDDGQYGTPEDNEVYDSGTMAGVDCSARLGSTKPRPYEDYVDDVIPCLDEAWRAQLSEQGIEFEEPGIVVSRGGDPSSPCGSADTGYRPAAFYCSTNRTIYFNLPASKDAPSGYAVRTAAHEYGHHVQELTGILPVVSERYENRYGRPAATARLTRRNELQAQCFAAVFLGGNAETMGTSKSDVVRDTGADDYIKGIEDDPSLRTHGNLGNNRYWLRRGWTTDAGACNTWTAPRSRVA